MCLRAIKTKHYSCSVYLSRAVFDGGWGVEPPPAKISDPPAAIKKRKGGRLSMYLCISTVVDFNSQNFDPPPLMKFDKYSPDDDDGDDCC